MNVFGLTMSHQIFGIIAGVLGVVQAIPYIISILRGETRPHRISWFILFVIDLIQLITYYSAGARGSIYLTAVFTIIAALIFALSFHYGMGGSSRLDLTCLVLSLIIIAIWVISGNAVLALYTSIVGSVFGYIPTILKSWRFPHTENTLSWVLGAFAALANLAAITVWRPSLIMLPVSYMILISTVTTILLLRTHRRTDTLSRPCS
jgi:hypothetical protein